MSNRFNGRKQDGLLDEGTIVTEASSVTSTDSTTPPQPPMSMEDGEEIANDTFHGVSESCVRVALETAQISEVLIFHVI